jgi:diguanylate cyclase (GGDEF)-like protein
MGRSLGVLHTTGADGEVPSTERVERLRTLAAQAGARIGTVRAFQKTQLQASTDSLTGLVNRRSAEEQMRSLLRGKRPFALALGDLDHFKQLNDTHGHEAGDRALRLFADTARRSIREFDTIARWGGEEFVVILPDLDRFGAVEVLERLRGSLARAHPGETPRFTVSFGVSDTEQAQGASLLFRVADEGLYSAKVAGRDRVTIGELPDDEGPRRHDAPADEEEPDELDELVAEGEARATGPDDGAAGDGNGAVDDGLAEDGALRNGAAEDGALRNGAAGEDGAARNGSAENGRAEKRDDGAGKRAPRRGRPRRSTPERTSS